MKKLTVTEHGKTRDCPRHEVGGMLIASLIGIIRKADEVGPGMYELNDGMVPEFGQKVKILDDENLIYTITHKGIPMLLCSLSVIGNNAALNVQPMSSYPQTSADLRDKLDSMAICFSWAHFEGRGLPSIIEF